MKKCNFSIPMWCPGLLSLVAAILLVFTGCNSQKSNVQESKSTDAEVTGFRSIFDGKSLKGWEGEPGHWKAENGDIVGYSTEETPLKANTFLIWREGQPSDFELMMEYKITDKGNSGVQYRSEELPDMPLVMKGYQADIDGPNMWTGQNYEERGRGFLAKRGEKVVLETGEKPEITGSLGDGEELKQKIRVDDWNTLHLIVQGNHMQHYVNGVLMSDVTDNDTESRKMEGLIGFQIHQGPPMEVRIRKIMLKDLK